MVFWNPKLTSRDYNLSLSNENKRNKVHFHSVTVTQSISQHSPPICLERANVLEAILIWSVNNAKMQITKNENKNSLSSFHHPFVQVPVYELW